MRSIAKVVALGLSVGAAQPVAAQSVAAPSSASDKPVYLTSSDVTRSTGKPVGWAYAVTLAANMNLTSNHDVVGQLDGNSVLFGGSMLTGLNYLRGPHELLNSLTVAEAWSRTPAIDRLIKSNDVVDLQILYNYFVNDWTGPFVRFGAQTTLFKTYKPTASTATYVRDTDPTETTQTSNFRLSDSLQPFTLAESIGWFVKPLRSEPLNVSLRVGFGGRQTFAEGARAVTDDEESPTGKIYTYTVLSDVHQAGAELFAGIDGKQMDGKVLYALGLTALFPLINNDDANRDIIELTRVGLTGALGMNVMSWLSVNYQLKVMRDVQLIDTVQVQNALLLSLQYARATPSPTKKPEKLSPETEARIAALEARASAAEQRAAAAEARAAEPPALPEPPADVTTE